MSNATDIERIRRQRLIHRQLQDYTLWDWLADRRKTENTQIKWIQMRTIIDKSTIIK